MNTFLTTSIQPQYQTIDGLRVRYADSAAERRDEYVAAVLRAMSSGQ